MTCVVPNCQQAKMSNEKISMHLFPDPTKDPKRHLTWIKAIKSEKVLKFDARVVFKRFRVCRNHFAKNCFNGDCKKILPTAIPTLNLGNHVKIKSKPFLDYEEKIFNMLKKNSVNVEEDSLRIIDFDDQTSIEQDTPENISAVNNEDEFLLMEVENCDNNQAQFTIVMPPSSENFQVSPEAPPKVLNYNRKLCLSAAPKKKSVPGILQISSYKKFKN